MNLIANTVLTKQLCYPESEALLRQIAQREV